MRSYMIRIEIKQGEIESIMKEIDEAQDKIYKCYDRLTELGVLTIRKEPPAATDGLTD